MPNEYVTVRFCGDNFSAKAAKRWTIVAILLGTGAIAGALLHYVAPNIIPVVPVLELKTFGDYLCLLCSILMCLAIEKERQAQGGPVKLTYEEFRRLFGQSKDAS